MTISAISARELAVSALIEILEEGGYNNIVLKRILGKYNGISPVERNMVTELVNGTLRNLLLIDYILAGRSKTPSKKVFIKNLLRISVYQLMFMDKVPDSAVCNEAVNLAKKKGLKGLSGYVNGILRSIARAKGNLGLPLKDKNLKDYLSVVYSHPKWLVEYWLSFMDASQVESICASNNAAPAVTISANTFKINEEDLKVKLEGEGVQASLTDHKNTLKVKGLGEPRNLESFKEGLYHIMDINAMKAVDLIAPQPGDYMLDLCAAPGGKSFYAAAFMKNQGKILSLDIHEHKLDLIKEGAKRQGFSIIEASINDASLFNNSYANGWDKVILDAPCSGLGVLAKKPDARYKKSINDIEALVKLQRSMLEVSCKYPKVGGQLLYCTCTISIKENEENTAWFLRNFPYEIKDEFRAQTDSKGPGDGFYAVSMIRRA